MYFIIVRIFLLNVFVNKILNFGFFIDDYVINCFFLIFLIVLFFFVKLLSIGVR